MTAVRVEKLTKAFGKTVAVNSVSLDIADGQLATLLGPSGCGQVDHSSLHRGPRGVGCREHLLR